MLRLASCQDDGTADILYRVPLHVHPFCSVSVHVYARGRARARRAAFGKPAPRLSKTTPSRDSEGDEPTLHSCATWLCSPSASEMAVPDIDIIVVS